MLSSVLFSIHSPMLSTLQWYVMLYGLTMGELYGLAMGELYGLTMEELYGLTMEELYGLAM